MSCGSGTSQDDNEESASAAKLGDLRVQAASQGVEWLRLAVSQIRKEELRALATAANVVTHGPDRKWLTMAQLCSELVNALMPATQARMYGLFEVFCESVIDMKGTKFLAVFALCQLYGFVLVEIWMASFSSTGTLFTVSCASWTS